MRESRFAGTTVLRTTTQRTYLGNLLSRMLIVPSALCAMPHDGFTTHPTAARFHQRSLLYLLSFC